MNRLLKEFKTARKNLISCVNKLPKDKRGDILFNKWSLKDILIHLTGWARYQYITLRNFRMGRELISPQNLEFSINDSLVAEKRRSHWRSIYDGFIKVSDQLIAEYEDLPQRLWGKKIWKGEKTTLKEFIAIEIRHYRNTHGPQINKVLKQYSNRRG